MALAEVQARRGEPWDALRAALATRRRRRDGTVAVIAGGGRESDLETPALLLDVDERYVDTVFRRGANPRRTTARTRTGPALSAS